MTLTELLNATTVAGAHYQAAVNELYASYIELAALDGALANRERERKFVRTFVHSVIAGRSEAVSSSCLRAFETALRLARDDCAASRHTHCGVRRQTEKEPSL